MSLGFQLLRSVVDASAQTSFRQCLPVWFAEEEQPCYQFVSQHLYRHGRLPSYATLYESGFSLPAASEPPDYYVEMAKNRAIFSQLQSTAGEYGRLVRDRKMQEALELLKLTIRNCEAVNPSASVTTFGQQAEIVMQKYREAQRTFSLIGVTLGWEILDGLTDGGQPGDVIVLVGRPGTGKTQALLWMLYKAWISGKSILLLSMEMSAEQITRRLIGYAAQVNPTYIRSGRLSSFGVDAIVQTISGLDDMPPLHIMSGNFRKSVSDIDKAAQEFAPDLIGVDAGYLVSPEKKSGSTNKHELIADVIVGLKNVATDRRRPLLTSVQFNRGVKRKQRGELDLSDIGGSDAIGQVGSIVLGMRYGNPPYEYTRRIIELIKNRDGENVKFEVNFQFTPPDMSFSRIVTDDDDGVEAQDLSDMA